MMFVSFNSNTTGVTSRVGTAHTSGAPLGSTSTLEGFVLLYLLFSVYCFVDHCLSFCLFIFVLSVLLLFTTSDQPLGIFKFCYSFDIGDLSQCLNFEHTCWRLLQDLSVYSYWLVCKFHYNKRYNLNRYYNTGNLIVSLLRFPFTEGRNIQLLRILLPIPFLLLIQ